MREAVTRRYTRLINEQADLPDLLLIDGGIGQVNAVEGILKALDLDIPIAGLAKRDEEIWRPTKRTALPPAGTRISGQKKIQSPFFWKFRALEKGAPFNCKKNLQHWKRSPPPENLRLHNAFTCAPTKPARFFCRPVNF
jgi:hypothetical protein